MGHLTMVAVDSSMPLLVLVTKGGGEQSILMKEAAWCF